MVRRELAALLGLLEAAAAGCEDDRGCVDRLVAAHGRPACGRGLERPERMIRERDAGRRVERLAEHLRDRMTRAVADLEQPVS